MPGAVETFVDRYLALGRCVGPAAPADIERFEQTAGVTLPAAYKAYLLLAGHVPPRAWVGSDCTLGRLPTLRVWADELLAECGQPPLPAKAVVFLMHQGYQFSYFVADGTSDDPPVYYYMEGDPAVRKEADRFSDLVWGLTAGPDRAAGGATHE